MLAATFPRRAALAGLGALGCAPAPARPAPAPRAGTAPARPPEDHVAAAGLAWLVLGRPARWFAQPDLRAACSTALGRDAEAALRELTGLGPAELGDAVVAGSALGTLGLVEASDGGAAAEVRFAARLADAPLERSPAAGVRWLSGVRGGRPQHLLRLPGRRVALIEGDTTLARVAVAYAMGRLTSPPALRGAALRTLPAPAAPPLLRVLWPGPFDATPAWAAGAHGLAAGLFAAELALDRAAPGRLRARAVLAGALPPDATDRLAQTWADLRASAVGRLLGLDAAGAGEARAGGDRVELAVEVAVDPLAAGLRDLVGPWPPPAPADVDVSL